MLSQKYILLGNHQPGERTNPCDRWDDSWILINSRKGSSSEPDDDGGFLESWGQGQENEYKSYSIVMNNTIVPKHMEISDEFSKYLLAVDFLIHLRSEKRVSQAVGTRLK